MGGFLHAPSKERVILSEVRKHGVEESSHYRQCCADILCEDPSIPHLRCSTQDDRCGESPHNCRHNRTLSSLQPFYSYGKIILPQKI